MLLRMQVCVGAASVCGGQELVSTADVCVCVCELATAQGGALWAGVCCIILSEIFSIIVHVSPVIISEIAVETKGPLQTGNDLWLCFCGETFPPDYSLLLWRSRE